jgi:hypothetical protein
MILDTDRKLLEAQVNILLGSHSRIGGGHDP